MAGIDYATPWQVDKYPTAIVIHEGRKQEAVFVTRIYTPFQTLWTKYGFRPDCFDNFENQFVSALLGQQLLKQVMVQAENAANQQIRAME
ncbi:MAG: hypothetical protein RMX96_06475 [Nostoc sp. ChiSLP02]|nr:hypothetical protein [Nostoc sp. DedSLP05]MDZ8099521.1 hypothetical protein [Nostoc sp. DedSLP01]MDZ8184479.1 hypothetical protein [Nostoc sp. ChiSLP02]